MEPEDKAKAKTAVTVRTPGFNAPTPAPEGEAWRTVPVNPPLEMIDAFLRHIPTDYAPDRHQKRAGYAAMLAASPVVPVGVSREEIARIIEPDVWSNLGMRRRMGYDTERDTRSSLRKADAIIAALRPTDTGGEA